MRLPQWHFEAALAYVARGIGSMKTAAGQEKDSGYRECLSQCQHQTHLLRLGSLRTFVHKVLKGRVARAKREEGLITGHLSGNV